ncbi:SH3 domain-containing protein [uncultured Aquimarina sp.]|uniref:SH3 domain-containing protein n=1 Tax=uncultured Aquimarina sp. TaxID=575652 RepID=UPI002624785B|nr:SH3 domain-containing protein [uncultured Aquimarina sp.]
MIFRITIILILSLFFSCKEKNQQAVKKTKNAILEHAKQKTISQDTTYYYVAENGTILYSDININYSSEKIDTLDFLEPVEILKKHKDLKHTVGYGGYYNRKDLKGYICKIRTLNGKVGFIFNQHLKTYDDLSKLLKMNGFDKKSIIKNGRLSKAEAMLRLSNSFDNKPSKNYFYTIANRLSLRKKPSLDAQRITVLKYLEPMEVIENLPNKKETIEDEEDGPVHGNWCKVRLLNGTEGYTFNGYIIPFNKLSEKLNPKGIEGNELLINGKLKTISTLNDFLEVMGRPDSIRSYNVVENDFSGKIQREYENEILHIVQDIPYNYLEYGEGGWIYNDINMKYYYKNGIEYEELNGETAFSNIDFTINNNYLEYNGFRIDSSTTLKTITKLFPIQFISRRQRYNHNDGMLFQFGAIREKNNGSEIYWQLNCSKKAESFNVYWYD